MLCGIADFGYRTAVLCQTAITHLVNAEALGLVPSFEELAAHLPTPRCCEERRLLHTQLKSMALNGAVHVHRAFHRHVYGPDCRADLIERSLSIWSDAVSHEGDARTRLSVWAHHFDGDFQRVHPWPAELVVEARVRQYIGRRMTIDELATDLPFGSRCSRTSIRRAFKRRFGIAISEYQRSVRATEAIRLLRETSWSNECIAKLLGYGSVKNLYGLVRDTTGLTPAELRKSRCTAEHRAPTR
jgi:AraC-like DNA-binding protein